MARRGENIYKRKDGRYEGRYVIGKTEAGKTRFGYVYASSYTKARAMLNERRFVQQQAEPKKAGKSMKDHMAFWLADQVFGVVKASSYQVYKNHVEKHINPIFGEMDVGEVTPAAVTSFAEKLLAQGLAESTVKGIYRTLSSGMRFALDEGLIEKNPCRKLHSRSCERQQKRIFTQKEQMMIAENAKEIRLLPILFGLYTGMRLGEVCALKWSDIDWNSRTVSVCRTVQRIKASEETSTRHTVIMIGSPKSASSKRVLPLPDTLYSRLIALKDPLNTDGYIFGSSKIPAEPRTIQRRFKSLLTKLGIQNAHFHTLRHSFATGLIELNVDIKTVSMLLGHNSAQITLDFYVHSLLERREKAIRLLDERLSKAVISRTDP